MAGSHTVHGVLGFLMSVIIWSQTIVWAGELWRMWELHLNFKSLQHRDSIHSITGVIRQCGCFQVHLKIQGMIQWWKCTVLMPCIPLGRVPCMPSRLQTMTLNRVRHTGWSNLPSPGQLEGGQNRRWTMGNHLFRYQRRIHILFISNGRRKSKLN